MEISELISNVGFPIAIAVYLLQREAKSNERVLAALEAATEAIQKSNVAIKDVIKKIERFEDKWSREKQ